ncbi:MAG: hypothetical protein ACYTG6_10770 [Planctomycetota bacterium]|jgi:hypothetical protein
MAASDVMGNEMTAAEERLLAAYEQLKALLEEDLSPSANANVREAVAALWQAVNNLALTDDRPDV